MSQNCYENADGEWVCEEINDTSGGSLGYEPGDTTGQTNDDSGGSLGYEPGDTSGINQDVADIGLMGDVGNLNITEKDGKYFHHGTLVYDPKDANGGILGTLNKLVDKTTFDKLKKLFVSDKGEVNLAGLASVAGGIYGLMGGNTPKTGGYKGTVPKYEAVRRSINQPQYTPYSGEPAMGRRYFSDVAYVPETDTAGIAAAEEAAAKQVAELEKYTPNIAKPKEVEKEKSKGIAGLQTPEQLIAKERGIVADKNVPTGDVMAEVKRLNPHLDWSKYNPDKITMDYDDFDRARDNYLQGKGYTPPIVGGSGEIENLVSGTTPQLSDAINILKAGGSKDDASKIMRQIVGLDGPVATPVDTNLTPGTYLSTGTGKITTVPSNQTLGGISTIPVQSDTTSTTDGQSGNRSRIFGRRMLREGAMQNEPTPLATGGIAMLAKGRYLRGQTDGMADKIPSSIDNKQPAKLSHGEFVIPADVVSHLGNGNSDAGADVLYKMMDRVRKARTGSKKQGKRINPAKFTPGGIAGYAGGGAVAFNAGGLSSTGVTGNATTETSLAPWAGDAVTDYIGRGTALAKEAFIPYQGALSAGASPLQQQAFEKAGGLGGTFDSAAASQYMNPYIQNALQPQLNELRRQADISQQALSGKFAGAGALGGARDAISRSEGIRNLLTQQSGVIGGAYKDAYDKAMQQYNTSRTQDLNDLNAMLGAGQTQRGIEEDKIKADRAAFEEERLDPYQKIKFEQSLFSGLPLSSTTTTPNLSPLQEISAAGKDITQLYDMINKWLKTV